MSKDLGKYPTLLEIGMGRKITAKERADMNDEYERASRAYDEYLKKKILGGKEKL